MATQALANWTVSLSYDNLPEEVNHAAVRSFYNITGCIVGGSTHSATTTTARKALSTFSGPPTS
ncbi:hypothetical protein N7457_001734 [Penicillium paradoxum]|uniref:uncharacterized protein n=1 Tax=Penicillium paradoxum TaxID=176176 RepID=UPI002546AE86|nr:uncharacterized protein N7457_001734 [Penicillium paradoxum]KAJ5795135.1 hypothetical protein N7457_001734 [Penicillium paradoxum]